MMIGEPDFGFNCLKIILTRIVRKRVCLRTYSGSQHIGNTVLNLRFEYVELPVLT